MKIALVLNTRQDDSEVHAEYDPPHTVDAIRQGIEAAGHEYHFIEGDEAALGHIQALKPDLVFNRSEGVRGESRESHIPAMLEMSGIPYVGSGVLTLALCLNKEWTKRHVRAAGVPTPQSMLIETENDLSNADLMQSAPGFPVILKPNAEGSSIGINEDNVVHDFPGLQTKARSMLATYREAILVESFIPGREISVGVLGTEGGQLQVLPMLEVDFSQLPEEVGNVFGQRAKSTYDDLAHYLCPAPLDPALVKQMELSSLTACRALGIRDFARIDFRIGSDGVPYFLEVNPLPGMDYDTESQDYSFFIIMALRAGLSYSQLVEQLLQSAWSRASRRVHHE
ncbi:MAG: ATP-grasp domain-containing protein [Spirochaetaceae bacterium]|nr:MAG: ATP-grasp domain-containing protein [Spirochaetaceae bacterium]